MSPPFRILSLLTAVCLASLAGAADPSDEPHDGGVYIISNVHSGKRLAIEKGSTEPKAKAVQHEATKTHVTWKLEKNGEKVEHVTPAVTFKIENPVAVIKNSKNAAAAKAFNDFLYTTAGQTAWAEAEFRPVDTAVAAKFASTFPTPTKLSFNG